MDVIWHDHPCEQPVSFSIILEQSLFHDSRNVWHTHKALTDSTIEIFFGEEYRLSLNVLGFAQGDLRTDRLKHALRERIIQSASDELNAKLSGIEVWQIAATIPAARSFRIIVHMVFIVIIC